MSSGDERSNPSSNSWNEKKKPYLNVRFDAGDGNSNSAESESASKKKRTSATSLFDRVSSTSKALTDLIDSDQKKIKQKERSGHSKPTKKSHPSPPNLNHKDQDESPSEFDDEANADLRTLVERLSHYYEAHHYHHSSSSSPGRKSSSSNPPIVIDKRRAYYLLEAAAGNVDLAVNLYWDDLVASSSSMSVNRNKGGPNSKDTNADGSGIARSRNSQNHASRHYRNRSRSYSKSNSFGDMSNARTKRQRTQSNENSAAAYLASSSRAIRKYSKRQSSTNEGMNLTEEKKPNFQAAKSTDMSGNNNSNASAPNLSSSAKRKAPDDEPSGSSHLFVARNSKLSSNSNRSSSSSKKSSTDSTSKVRINNPTELRSNTNQVPSNHSDKESNAHSYVPRRLNPNIRLPLRGLNPDLFQRPEEGRSEEEKQSGRTSRANSDGSGEAFEFFQKLTQDRSQSAFAPNLNQDSRRVAVRSRENNAAASVGNNSSNSNNNNNNNNVAPPGANRDGENNNQEENEDADANKNSVSISDDEAAATARFCRIFNDLDDENGNEEVGRRCDGLAGEKRHRRRHRSAASLKLSYLKHISRERHRKRMRESAGNHSKEAANNEDDEDIDVHYSPNTCEDTADFSDSDSDSSAASSNRSSNKSSNKSSKGFCSVIWGKRPSPDPNESQVLDLIPKTWMNAFFSLSSSRNGLHIIVDGESQPNQKVQSSHPGGFTAIAALVTALIQAGVSTQGQKVSCNKNQTRFSDLSRFEKARQFHSRLADALTSLLFIAAQASINYKKVVAERRKKKFKKGNKYRLTLNEENDLERVLHRGINLCRVCKWEDNSSGQRRGLVGVSLSSSLTNILDLRSYVLSQMDAFTSRGGFALFLETIVKIHGESRVKRMLRSASGKESLISCDCINKNIPKGKSKFEWLDHLGHECASVELISFLITGQIYSSYEGWDAGDLGIGILGLKNSISIDNRLMHPSKPVWVVRGEKCFSAMWLEDLNDIDYMKERGSAFKLVHWNCWSVGKKNVIKVITSRRPSNVELPSSDVIRDFLQNITHDTEDEHFYPDQYKRWRFDLGKAFSPSDDKNLSKEISETKSEHRLIPYFRLDQKQKLFVDMKYSPNIHMIVWSRWIEATVLLCTTSTPPIV